MREGDEVFVSKCLLFCVLGMAGLGVTGCLKPVNPTPGPDVVTPVAASHLLIVVVESRLERTPDSPQSDLNFWERLRTAGHEFRFVESDNDYAARFKTQVDRHKVPCLLLVRKPDGKVLKSCPLPSKDEIESLVTKYGAK